MPAELASDPRLERVDIVDEQDRVVYQTTRSVMRQQNLLHRVVAVLCLNARGQIYVHQRAPTKDLFPSLYDMFIAGTVCAGESYAATAARELAEELAIVGPEPEFLFHHRYEGTQTRSHAHVYRVVWDGPIAHQASEIVGGAFFTRQALVENREQLAFVPDGAELFARYVAEY